MSDGIFISLNRFALQKVEQTLFMREFLTQRKADWDNTVKN